MRAVPHTPKLILLLFILLGMGLPSARADKGADHQDRLPRPIQLGVSGGDYEHLDCPAGCYCCAGTLGALVEDLNGKQYILGNNHVLGMVNRSTPGDPILQPGLIDQNPICVPDGNDVVANFTELIPISSVAVNSVDAAVAATTDAVRSDGSILDIGPLSAETLEGYVGLKVKKSGRTTGLTKGEIVATNVTVSVGYSTQCGGSTDFVATFSNQLRIRSTKGRPGGFSAGGDSGSVIVEDEGNSPRAVGLLFAGSSLDTIASRIDDVLTAGWSVGDLVMAGGAPPTPSEDCSNGLDDDGDNLVDCNDPDCQVDADGDGWTTCDGDCNDGDASVYPGATEVCDGVDNDCNGQIDEGFDNDNDGWTTCDGDCDDTDASINPGAPEDCDDGLDNDCDGTVDCPAAGGSAIVDCITWTTEGGRNGDKHMNFVVTIVDDVDDPVAGASVSVGVTLNGSPFGSATGATDGNGNVTFTAKNSPNGCYQADVTAVAASGLNFDGAEPSNGFDKGADSTPDADCRGGSDDCGGGAFVATKGADTGGGPRLRAVIAAKHRHERGLLDVAGVVGVGVGRGAAGKPVIEIYLEADSPSARARIPAQLETVPVRVIVTGPFVAY